MNLQIFPDIEVHLRRSGRARQLTLRVSSLDGKVSLTAPNHAKTHQIKEFLRGKENWLREKRSQIPESVFVTFGTRLPFMGGDITVCGSSVRKVTLSDEKILIPEHSKRPGAQVGVFLKQYARHLLEKKAAHYAEKLGKPFSKLSLRDTRSRWGSCSDRGALMFSWRLIMAPVEVLEYVVAHEVAHLKHMNHSDQFWTEVKTLYGDYKFERHWLRENGSTLHQFQFYH
jgi:predicted metal-dependent hydrolase